MKNVHSGELIRYHALPKTFVGPLEADDLFVIYERLQNAYDSFGYLSAAASAATESGLMATHLTKDERHHRLQCADQAWQDASTVFFERHFDKDWSDAQLFAVPDRVHMNRVFMPLFHDFVDGNIRETTIDKVHQRLVHLGSRNLMLHDQAESEQDVAGFIQRRGLGNELSTIMSVTRLRCPSFFAIPATVRADNGVHFPELTHDVRLIRQSWGRIENCIPCEVKGDNTWQRDQYKSAFVRGRVELMMPSAKHPLELARFIYEEQQGTITPKHLAELNEVTSKVLRQALDYDSNESISSLAS